MTHLITTVGSNIVIEIRATRIPMNGIERPKGVQGDLLPAPQQKNKFCTNNVLLCSGVQVAQGGKGVFVFQSHGVTIRSKRSIQSVRFECNNFAPWLDHSLCYNFFLVYFSSMSSHSFILSKLILNEI